MILFHKVTYSFDRRVEHFRHQHLAGCHHDYHNVNPFMETEAENEDNNRKNQLVSDADFKKGPLPDSLVYGPELTKRVIAKLSRA
jgi:hypothetical protein